MFQTSVCPKLILASRHAENGTSANRWEAQALTLQRAQTAPAGKYKNTLDILTKTVKNEGPLALYKGKWSIQGAFADNRHGACFPLDVCEATIY